MCGINGVFLKQTGAGIDPKALIQKMNEAIRHRGPDDSGVFFENTQHGSLGFGHVRLSILDLSLAGHQPMRYAKNAGASSEKYNPELSGDITIVFNGEIYNYEEIKTDLISKNYTFTTRCDTEVILASYLEWGEKCVQRFNGFWSFVIYDPRNDILFCSRDRFGKKPFYYSLGERGLCFSSEIKSLLTTGIKKTIDPEALDFYFSMGFIPAPWSIYQSVRKLESGHNALYNFRTGEWKTYRYFDLPKYAPIYDKKSLIAEGKELLEDATKIRMFADVPVGAFLSGGLDSSSVVAEMTKFVKKENLHTFSVGFEGKYDETHYIEIVKDAFGTNHHHKYFKQKDFEIMVDAIAQIYDEPFGDYSNFPTTFVSELAKEHVTVSLSGDGGDEVFGGYMMHQVAAQMTLIRKLPKWSRKLLYTIIPKTRNNLSLFSKLKEAMRVSLLPKEDFYAEIGGCTIHKPEVVKQWSREKLSHCLETSNGDFTQAIIDYDLIFNTLGDNFLVKTDRASMSCALEIRSPFLDYRFVEYSRKIPVKWKVSWRKTKILMREIIRDIVPEVIWRRGKQGFTPPLDQWIGDHLGKLKESLNILYSQGVISKNWHVFYTEKVLNENNRVFNVYKIKLYLFLKWFEKWK